MRQHVYNRDDGPFQRLTPAKLKTRCFCPRNHARFLSETELSSVRGM